MKRRAKAIVAISSLLALSILAFGITLASAAAPTVTIEPVSGSYNSAHVSGTINPNGGPGPIYYNFEYKRPSDEGWSSRYGGEISGPEAEGTTPITVERNLEDLAPATEFEVRIGAYAGETGTFSAATTFATKPVAAPDVSIAAVSSLTPTSAHLSALIDPNAPEAAPASPGVEAAFRVGWRFECNPECPLQESGAVVADNTVHAVGIDVVRLVPGTQYEITLIGENASGPVTAGPISFTTPPALPAIKGVLVTPAPTTAKLTGTINPGSVETTYHFEYGPTSAYGQTSPTGTIPAGNANVTVNTLAIGLTPGATYHYRLVATNSAGTVQGADRTFTAQLPRESGDSCPNAAVRAQQRAQNLPECRAYEQVSPVDKNSSDVQYHLALADDGRAISWASLGAYADPLGPGGGSLSVYTARRGASGWQVRNMEPPANEFARPGLDSQLGAFSFTADLSSETVISKQRLNPAEDTDYLATDVYRLRPGQQAKLLSHGVSGVSPGDPIDASLVGSSPDGSSDFFRSEEKLDPAAPDGVQSLYRNRNGEVELVSRDESGAPLASGAVLGAGGSITVLGSGTSGDQPDSNAVSPDGSSFAYSAGGTLDEFGDIYLREADGTIRIINRSQRSGEVGDLGPNGAQFVGASADFGTFVIRSRDRLSDDAPAGGGMYIYSAGSKALTFLAVDSALQGSSAAGVVRISSDGRRIYYVSRTFFIPGNTAGISHLYVWSKGEGIREIGPVDDGYVVSWSMPHRTNAWISDGGRHLLFNTKSDPTGNEPSGMAQVYLYDYDADRVVCISCGPAGGVPAPAQMAADAWAVVDPARAITVDGSRAIFTSAAQLLPEDTNAAKDAYLWVRSGGTCKPGNHGFDPESGGCIYLLSSGNSPTNSQAIGISPDGEDVYIETRSSLTLSDTDREQNDVYDVRIGGGTFVPDGTPPCAGETCRGPLSSAATQEGAGSAAFAGAANEKPNRRKPCRATQRKGARKSAKARCGKPRKHKQQAGKGRKGGRK